MKRILVLISGNGSNLQTILDGCAGGKIAGEVVGVISNKAD
ncbi:formyltransferase family protein, partial [Escherichia coli]